MTIGLPGRGKGSGSAWKGRSNAIRRVQRTSWFSVCWNWFKPPRPTDLHILNGIDAEQYTRVVALAAFSFDVRRVPERGKLFETCIRWRGAATTATVFTWKVRGLRDRTPKRALPADRGFSNSKLEWKNYENLKYFRTALKSSFQDRGLKWALPAIRGR